MTKKTIEKKASPRKKTAAPKNRISGNGKADTKSSAVPRQIIIPKLEKVITEFRLVGDRPLMVNNKLNVAEAISDTYHGKGGKTSAVPRDKATPDEQYRMAFYVMPNSKHPAPHPKALYGVPTSGIKKCADKGIRLSGITDNNTIGVISRSFGVLSDGGGLCLLHYKTLERDIRPVNIGSGQKTTPQMRHRPRFDEWYINLRVEFNPRNVSEETILNLFTNAGQWVGLCEMRFEKKQGECGGFYAAGMGK